MFMYKCTIKKIFLSYYTHYDKIKYEWNILVKDKYMICIFDMYMYYVHLFEVIFNFFYQPLMSASTIWIVQCKLVRGCKL